MDRKRATRKTITLSGDAEEALSACKKEGIPFNVSEICSKAVRDHARWLLNPTASPPQTSHQAEDRLSRRRAITRLRADRIGISHDLLDAIQRAYAKGLDAGELHALRRGRYSELRRQTAIHESPLLAEAVVRERILEGQPSLTGKSVKRSPEKAAFEEGHAAGQRLVWNEIRQDVESDEWPVRIKEQAQLEEQRRAERVHDKPRVSRRVGSGLRWFALDYYEGLALGYLYVEKQASHSSLSETALEVNSLRNHPLFSNSPPVIVAALRKALNRGFIHRLFRNLPQETRAWFTHSCDPNFYTPFRKIGFVAGIMKTWDAIRVDVQAKIRDDPRPPEFRRLVRAALRRIEEEQ